MRAAPLPLLAITSLLAACASSAGNGDGGADARDTSVADALTAPDALDARSPCEGPIAPGGACATTVQCTLPRQCVQCGFQRYIFDTPSCTCVAGMWRCLHVECFGPGAGVFTDPDCTRSSVLDAGAPDSADDAANDACGAAPRPDASLTEGETCAPPTTRCGARCADLSTDPANCGACGVACAPGQLCQFGSCVCECAAGLAVCAAGCDRCRCVDLRSDALNCGACGRTCSAATRCVDGDCMSPDAGRD